MKKNYIDLLKKLNNNAKKNGDIPVSVIILKDNKIIAKAYNKKRKNNDPLAHAEIIAIRKACRKLKTSNLNDCEMIVTLKPCNMCQNIINESRLKIVYYILDNNKEINNTVKFIKIEENQEYFEKEIKDFFSDKR